MKTRKYHTPMNLLLEPDMYIRIKMISAVAKISMSNIIREGIKLWLVQYDKKNNSMVDNENEKEDQKGA